MRHFKLSVLVLIVLFMGTSTHALAQRFGRNGCHRCGKCPSCLSDGSTRPAPLPGGSTTAPVPGGATRPGTAPAPAPGMPPTTPSQDPFAPPATDPGLDLNDPSVQRSLRGDRVSNVASTFAPNMIGDSFASGSSQSQIVVGSWSRAGFDVLNDGVVGADNRLTWTNSGAGAWADGHTVPVGATFRSVPTQAEIDAQIGSSSPGYQEVRFNVTEMVDAANQPALRSDAQTYFESQYGPGGEVLYDQDASEGWYDSQLPGSTYDGYLDAATWWYDYAMTVDVPNPGGGGVVGRQKIADNTSPLPQDRLLFGYSYFHNVPLNDNGVNVSRFTPGFEKTFLGGLASIEMKMPMAVTLDSTIVQDGSTDTSNDEFGNLHTTLKGVLFSHGGWAFSSGVTVTAPTASDVRLVMPDGSDLVEIRNNSVHLMPFFSSLWIPSPRFYAQGFLQYDIDTNGCPVSINADGNGLVDAGRVNDVTYQYMDLGVGYWLQQANPYFGVPGVALTSEIHWNKSLQETDVISSGNFRIGDYSSNIETWDLTVGAHVQFPSNWTVTAAYIAPLGGGMDRQFDGEFRLMLNRRFGGPTLASQAPMGRM